MAPSPQALITDKPAPSKLRGLADALALRLSRVTSGEHLIPEVDGLRFAALMLVILHHAVAAYLTTAQPLGPISLPMEWLKAGSASRFFFVVSHVGVALPMFFVLSGFILSLPFLRALIDGTPSPSIKRFWLRRLTRMEPPYFIALLLVFALLVWQGKPVLVYARHLAASAFYLHGSIYGGGSWILPVAWTLEIDAQFYLALPILQRLLFRKNRTTRRILMAGIILAGGLASQLYFDGPQAPRALNLGLANWIQFFVAGFLLADIYLDYWRNRPARHPHYWDAAGAIFFALLFVVVLQRYHPRIPWWVQRSWNGGAAAFLVPWLVIAAFAGVLRGQMLKWLAARRWVVIGGGMSYTVYLYHYTLIELLIRPVSSVIGSVFKPVMTSILVFLILLVPIFAISAVLFILVEKPFMRWRPTTLGFVRLPAPLSRMLALTQREALLAAALLIAAVKSLEFCLDSQALFSPDSGSYILNGLGLDFLPFHSYVYGGLIRIFAVPFHSLRAIVVMQVIMGALTAWLLAFALMRYLRVRAAIAILAVLVFAVDPVQLVHERMVMSETAALLAMALFLVAALEYLSAPSLLWPIALSFLGVLLVSLRVLYLPVVLSAAVLLPLAAWFWSSARRPRILALALAVSCGSTFLFQEGYRNLTGWLGHREAAYHYTTGFFLLASVTPIIEPGDSRDPRVAEAVALQSKSAAPFLMGIRWIQLWRPEGLIARLRTAFGGDEKAADQAAGNLAAAAIRRNPAGFLGLGVRTYLDYWREYRDLGGILELESGMQPPHLVGARDAAAISAAFHADVSNQDQWHTLSRRYQIEARGWYLFLLVTPLLAGLAWRLHPANPKGVALLFFWSVFLLAATCLGAAGSTYRYLHPFSFIALAAGAVLCERLAAHGGAGDETGAMALARIPVITQRRPLLVTAVLLVLVKSIQFLLDSQALFFPDSGAFILNALGTAFIPSRSYVYGWLIRLFAIPLHSLSAIVAMQIVMGVLIAWLLAFVLLRFFYVRGWIAILAALVFAMDPVQVLYEHMVMTETASLLAMAIFLLAALQYLRSRSTLWLPILSFLGALLVGLRTVYLPVVLVTAVLLPLLAWFWPPAKRPRPQVLALALVVSCGSTFLFQAGYRDLTGWLGHREPAYHYATGFFLLASVTPIVEPRDSSDSRIAQAVAAQMKSGPPLTVSLRGAQLWEPEGLVAKIKAVFGTDEKAADEAAGRLAKAAIRRNPFGFVRLGIRTYLGFWGGLRGLQWRLQYEDGALPPHPLNKLDAQVISSAFGVDVWNQGQLRTLTRRYTIFTRYWYLFPMMAPFLTGLAWWLDRTKALALLFIWNVLLLVATCLGGVSSPDRYLHPFCFTGMVASAVLYEEWTRRRVSGLTPSSGAASNAPTETPD